MPCNEKSLTNLKPGGKTGTRKKLVVNIKQKIDDYLTDNHSKFVNDMRELSPKDFCNAYIKLMAMVIPKNINLATEPEHENPKFIIIQPVSTVKPESPGSDN